MSIFWHPLVVAKIAGLSELGVDEPFKGVIGVVRDL